MFWSRVTVPPLTLAVYVSGAFGWPLLGKIGLVDQRVASVQLPLLPFHTEFVWARPTVGMAARIIRAKKRVGRGCMWNLPRGGVGGVPTNLTAREVESPTGKVRTI